LDRSIRPALNAIYASDKSKPKEGYIREQGTGLKWFDVDARRNCRTEARVPHFPDSGTVVLAFPGISMFDPDRLFKRLEAAESHHGAKAAAELSASKWTIELNRFAEPGSVLGKR
jgi:hypothetical protein